MSLTISGMPRPKKGKVPRRPVTYRLPENLLDSLELLADSTRRSQTAELEIALEAHLTRHKLWPPKPKPGHDDDD
jgi:predicted transcriptional regulator